MSNIITSKTRGQIRAQPREYAKLLGDLRERTMERHHVHSIAPVNGQTEDEVHKELDEQGAFINESMEANRERNRLIAKEKQKARETTRDRTARERIAALKARDEKSGVSELARRFLAGSMTKKGKR